MIDEFGEYLVPDLKHYFGIDLLDYLQEVPPHSPSFVLTHISWLPIDSAFVAEIRGGQKFRGWNGDRYMAAQLIDVLRTTNYILLLANSDPKKPKPKPPEPYPLPDSVKRPKAADKPGSFAFIAKSRMSAVKKMKEGGAPDGGISRGQRGRTDLNPGRPRSR